MSLDEKLRTRARPYLEAGEGIQAVFLAQGGPSPSFALLSPILGLLSKHRVIAVTDRAILMLETSPWMPARPTGLEARLPRETRLGPLPSSGWWAEISLNEERLFVHQRFHCDVEAADAAIGFRPGTLFGR